MVLGPGSVLFERLSKIDGDLAFKLLCSDSEAAEPEPASRELGPDLGKEEGPSESTPPFSTLPGQKAACFQTA